MASNSRERFEPPGKFEAIRILPSEHELAQKFVYVVP
jgi:hypothetical protein